MSTSTTSKLVLIGALYLSQGIPNGFFRHTVPVVFRESGISLEKIALFLPVIWYKISHARVWLSLQEPMFPARHLNF